MTLCYDSLRCASVLHIFNGTVLHTFDARTVADGPVCTLQLPEVMPVTIHDSFTPELLMQGRRGGGHRCGCGCV